MKLWERIFIAGSGALAPLAISFLTMDYQNIFQDTNVAIILGYTLRVFVLFWLGAIVGLINRNVRDKKVIFQLGITAPALVSGMIAANASESHTPPTKKYYLEEAAELTLTFPENTFSWTIPAGQDLSKIPDKIAIPDNGTFEQFDHTTKTGQVNIVEDKDLENSISKSSSQILDGFMGYKK